RFGSPFRARRFLRRRRGPPRLRRNEAEECDPFAVGGPRGRRCSFGEEAIGAGGHVPHFELPAVDVSEGSAIRRPARGGVPPFALREGCWRSFEGCEPDIAIAGVAERIVPRQNKCRRITRGMDLWIGDIAEVPNRFDGGAAIGCGEG